MPHWPNKETYQKQLLAAEEIQKERDKQHQEGKKCQEGQDYQKFLDRVVEVIEKKQPLFIEDLFSGDALEVLPLTVQELPAGLPCSHVLLSIETCSNQVRSYVMSAEKSFYRAIKFEDPTTPEDRTREALQSYASALAVGELIEDIKAGKIPNVAWTA